MTTDWGIDRLRMLASGSHARSHLRNIFLLNGACNLWGDLDPTRFGEAFAAVFHALGETPDRTLLVDHLITDVLLRAEDCPAWQRDWVRPFYHARGLCGELSWEEAAKGCWTAVPTLVMGARPFLRYWTVGWAPAAETDFLPAWVSTMLDAEAEAAVIQAAETARAALPQPHGGCLTAYPLAAAADGVQFTGGSLGLPLALGFHALLQRRRWPGHGVATGAIDSEGAVLPVQALGEKAALAEQKGFTLLLYPEGNHFTCSATAVEAVPVQNLTEAAVMAACRTPHERREWAEFVAALNSPERLPAFLAAADTAWLGRCLADRGCLTRIRRSIVQPDGLVLWVGTLESALSKNDLERAELLVQLMDDAAFEAAAAEKPSLALRWCCAALSVNNHRGRVAEAAAWANRGERFLPDVRRIKADLCSEFFNRRLVLHHNQYRFDPRIPDEILPVLNALEERYALSCRQGCTVDETLGAFYGSIAQNFGFCGPAHLDQTTAYAEKAVTAFGGGTALEIKDQALRQYSYLTYAYLDAKRWAEARKSLMVYLSLPHWEALPEHLPRLKTGYPQAALVRFLADCGTADEAEAYLQWAEERFGHLPSGHPWQLWLYNMGRLCRNADRTADAADYFQRSLAACLSPSMGPTVRMMALLPAAELNRLKELSGEAAALILDRVRRSAQTLNPVHFKRLKNASADEILAEVWRTPEAYFPFSYR